MGKKNLADKIEKAFLKEWIEQGRPDEFTMKKNSKFGRLLDKAEETYRVNLIDVKFIEDEEQGYRIDTILVSHGFCLHDLREVIKVGSLEGITTTSPELDDADVQVELSKIKHAEALRDEAKAREGLNEALTEAKKFVEELREDNALTSALAQETIDAATEAGAVFVKVNWDGGEGFETKIAEEFEKLKTQFSETPNIVDGPKLKREQEERMAGFRTVGEMFDDLDENSDFMRIALAQAPGVYVIGSDFGYPSAEDEAELAERVKQWAREGKTKIVVPANLLPLVSEMDSYEWDKSTENIEAKGPRHDLYSDEISYRRMIDGEWTGPEDSNEEPLFPVDLPVEEPLDNLSPEAREAAESMFSVRESLMEMLKPLGFVEDNVTANKINAALIPLHKLTETLNDVLRAAEYEKLTYVKGLLLLEDGISFLPNVVSLADLAADAEKVVNYLIDAHNHAIKSNTEAR